jgi:hypothetical protein
MHEDNQCSWFNDQYKTSNACHHYRWKQKNATTHAYFQRRIEWTNCKLRIWDLPQLWPLWLPKSMYGWEDYAQVDWPHPCPLEEHQGTHCFPVLISSIPWDWCGSWSWRLHVLVSALWCCNQQINQMWNARKWEDWMMEWEGIVNGAAKKPLWKLIAEWLVDV